MKPRLPILGVVVLSLTLALALRENFLRQRDAAAGATEPAAALIRTGAPNPPPRANRKSANDPAPMATETPAAGDVPGPSRFKAALAALPFTADTDDWAPTLDRLALSVPEADLGSAIVELTGSEAHSPEAMLRERLLARWTRLAPAAASAWVVGIDNPAERGEGMLQVAAAWAESDPSAAAGWATSLSNENERFELLLQLAHEAVREEPLRALGLAAGLPAGPSRDGLLAQAAGSWATRDPLAAAEWARSLRGEAERERALESVAVNWAGTDGIAAAKFALENLPRGDALDRAVVAVVQRWAQSDPRSVAAWIEQLEPEAFQGTAADNLVSNWFARDVPGPATWLESLPPGALRDDCIASYARQLASVKPALAAEWLSLIANADLRRRAEETLAVFTRAHPPHPNTE